MPEGPPLPTFLIIGASKAGTTSLHHYMAAHPGIAMTRRKDPHLMIGPRVPERVRQYAALFPGDIPVRGDCSTGYSALPMNPEAPDNIAELTTEARFIYLVRDPVERTIAHYAQHVITAVEDKPLEQAVSVDDPHNLYVALSRYATQVEAYLRRFDQGRMLVIDSVELRERRRETLRRAFAHVGADPEFWDEELDAEHNLRERENLRLNPLGRRLKGSVLTRASRRLLPNPVHRSLTLAGARLLGKEIHPSASPELRARLAEALGPEAERLRRLTGQRFASWSV